MALTISGEDYDALFDATLEQSRCLNPENVADSVAPYPSELGHGQIQRIKLREGLGLSIESYQQHDDIAVSFNDHAAFRG
ncbi:hypothetical protein ACQ4M3_17005 [Leptolyngbya sp. AN03gr2]|uniref:hypothetical protein n=1 Tax=unclassified Leptolyngbya TaxID=2650499 RepID=UPI003D32209A